MTDGPVLVLAERRAVGMDPDEKEATLAELRTLIENIESGEVYALALCALGHEEITHTYAGAHDDPFRLIGALAALSQWLIHFFHVSDYEAGP